MAQITATNDAEKLSEEVAEHRLTKAAKAKGAVALPGETVIMRAYTFSNYAGRPLRRGAHCRPRSTAAR